MGIRSMTGFSRVDRETDELALRWELKSVNGRNLELRFRLPPGYDSLELALRAIAGKRLFRGNVQATLTTQTAVAARAGAIDEARLEAYAAMCDRLVAEGRATRPSADGLLALKGVIDSHDESRQARAIPDAALDAAMVSFERAVEDLEGSRADEGANLAAVVGAFIDRIETLSQAARVERSRNPDIVRQRIKDQAERLVEQTLDEQRLLQELALISVRADIGEEIDRLASHVTSARELLVKNEPVGRRFDFLAQEMNRESNTICSKSNSVALTAIGLDLKVAVDQLREQVQNIE
ncbi:YicC/YloC family endoribonuclease [Fulvimarina sp. 2208YS6-2-32]|uniref:YicC/YloC family endoribonuclease n=1 Tax=Fulvimarina uroteuthidis TaxID=3098149 RepID=A0ABU5I4Y7_9HYPH|nr:YicC/YloC family endoribonuclease [Fulvimarina sp. 2208YS6-2-32]MDY8110460.1 YicC/YloC family endoribonuclease [Fulvimarina sp. 2208YS6-2-32]